MKIIINVFSKVFFSWIGLLFWSLLFYNVGWRVMAVPSQSMQKTLYPGDFYIANMHAYGINSPTLYNLWNPKLSDKLIIKKPNVGDIIIFEYKDILLVKRCIANEGDTIEVINNNVKVNGKLNPFKEFAHYDKNLTSPDDFPSTVVPAGHCFALGDNRNNSLDSRFIGPIPYNKIIGKASFRFLSLEEDNMFKSL